MSISIIFICMGNICRSPTAEGVFRKLSAQRFPDRSFIIDSAGTIGHHAGEHPDTRAIQAAQSRGYDISNNVARQVTDTDFNQFDLILAMDKDNYRQLVHHALSSNQQQQVAKIKLFLDYSQQRFYKEVPDPYYGNNKGFDLVIDLIEDASKGLLEEIAQHNQ